MASIFGAASIFGRMGSSAFWANRVNRKFTREDESILISPPKWDLSNLPEVVLISVNDECSQLRVQSAVSGVEYDWRGPAVPRAAIFKYLKVGNYSWDIEKFIDYVYMFRQVLYNVKTHEFSGVDTKEPLGGQTLPDEHLIRSSLA